VPVVGRPVAVAYFGGIGLALLVRAGLPPVETVPEIPAALLFLGIAAALYRRGSRAVR
jgi:hypothetical protein